jgi:hypothetical protein
MTATALALPYCTRNRDSKRVSDGDVSWWLSSTYVPALSSVTASGVNKNRLSACAAAYAVVGIASFLVRRDVVSQVAQSCERDADGALHCGFQLFGAVALLQADERGGKGCAHD